MRVVRERGETVRLALAFAQSAEWNRPREPGGRQRLRSAQAPLPWDPERTSVSAGRNYRRVVPGFYRNS